MAIDPTTGLAIGSTLASVGASALGIESNKKAAKRQYNNQRKLNEQGAELALQMWKDTNYSAQTKELEKAGLNKGLIYGMSGGGATTANAGSGGSAQAQQGGDFSGAVGMGINGAQLKLMNAQAENLEADTENKRGVERENKAASTGLTNVITEGNKLANELAGKTLDDKKEIVRQELLKVAGQAQQEQSKGKFADANETEINKQVKINTAYAELKNKLTESDIEVNDAQIEKMANDIIQGNFNAETARNTIGIDKVGGTLLQNIVNEIYNVIGYDKNHADQTVK